MSQDRFKFSEISDDEANEYRQDPARRVAAPGLALILVGCLGIVANLILAVSMPTLRQDRGQTERPAGMDDETFKSYERGRAAAPLLDCCIITVPTLAVYPLVIFAGVRMRQLKSRGFAMVGAIFAMAPCSPAMLIGVPIGIWVLIVLANHEVRAAFADSR